MTAAAAAATKSRKKTSKAPVRRDPRHARHIDGTSPWMQLINKRPDRVYKAIDKNDQMYGVAYYEMIGYVIEKVESGPNALRFAAGKTGRPGDDLENFGHVIMSVSQERADEIEQYGVTGDGGQNEANLVEQRIVNKRGGYDPLRGIHGVGSYIEMQKQWTENGVRKGIQRPEVEAPEEVPEGLSEDPEDGDDPFATP